MTPVETSASVPARAGSPAAQSGVLGVRVRSMRELVVKVLAEAGFSPGSYVWVDNPNRLILCIRGQQCVVSLKANTKRTTLERILGRLQGYGEMLRMMEAQTP